MKILLTCHSLRMVEAKEYPACSQSSVFTPTRQQQHTSFHVWFTAARANLGKYVVKRAHPNTGTRT